MSKTHITHNVRYLAIQTTIDIHGLLNPNSYVAAVLHVELLSAANKRDEVRSAAKEYLEIHPKKSTLLCYLASRSAFEVQDLIEALHWARKVNSAPPSCTSSRPLTADLSAPTGYRPLSSHLSTLMRPPPIRSRQQLFPLQRTRLGNRC